MSIHLPKTENSLNENDYFIKDKYSSVLKLGKCLDVQRGDVKEEGGKLILSGTAAYGLDKSKISKKYLDNPNRYGEIFNLNKDILSNPDLIKVGHRLKIPNK